MRRDRVKLKKSGKNIREAAVDEDERNAQEGKNEDDGKSNTW